MTLHRVVTDLYYETISVKASPSERDDIYWENPNGPSSSRTWKKCRILLKRQSVSSKQLKATVGRKNVISQATVKATEATVGWLRAGLPTSKNKIFCSKEAQVQDFYWIVFLLLSPVLCLSSSPPDSQGNLKDQKETKTWSFSSSLLAKTILADRLSTDGHQPLIQLLDCLDLIFQPCSQILCRPRVTAPDDTAVAWLSSTWRHRSLHL